MADYDYFEFDRNDSIGNPDIKPRKVGTPQKPVKEGHYESLDTDQLSNANYNEPVVSGTVSGATGLDITAANLFQHTLTGNTTFTFDNPTDDPPGNSFTLFVQQDSTGGHAITWPASVEWDGGTEPTLSTAAGKKHILGFISPDGGATWVGLVSAEGVA